MKKPPRPIRKLADGLRRARSKPLPPNQGFVDALREIRVYIDTAATAGAIDLNDVTEYARSLAGVIRQGIVDRHEIRNADLADLQQQLAAMISDKESERRDLMSWGLKTATDAAHAAAIKIINPDDVHRAPAPFQEVTE